MRALYDHFSSLSCNLAVFFYDIPVLTATPSGFMIAKDQILFINSNYIVEWRDKNNSIVPIASLDADKWTIKPTSSEGRGELVAI